MEHEPDHRYPYKGDIYDLTEINDITEIERFKLSIKDQLKIGEDTWPLRDLDIQTNSTHYYYNKNEQIVYFYGPKTI